MNKFLHIITVKQACAIRVNHFYAKQPCQLCGSREKYLLNFGSNSCLCVGCYPEPWVRVSYGQLKYAESKHNAEKAKLKKKNWSIPTVYGGFNTV